MTSTARSTGSVTPYVAVVATAGVAAVVAGTILLPTAGARPLVAAAMAVAIVLGTWVPLRFQHRGETQGVTIDEAILIATLLTVPVGLVPGLAALGALVAHGVQRQQPMKLAFNVGQVAVYASAAAAVFHLVGPGETVLELRTLLAVAAAGVTVNVVSLGLFAELFRRLAGSPWRETVAETASLYGITWIGNTSAGLLIALLIRIEPAAALLTTTLLAGLYLGYRGYAGVLEERRRNERLHDVTRSLVGVSASPEAMRAFISDVADLLGAQAAELLLAVDDDQRTVVHTDPDHAGPQAESAGLLGHVLALPVPLGIAGSGDEHAALLGTSGHRDALAAPLLYEGRVLGALAVYDRHGLEPWGASDLVLLASVANEAAVAVKNVELFAAVERERARLAEESRKLGDIVGAASDGIVMVDADRRVAAWNPAMTAITGIDADEAVGRPWNLVLRLRGQDGREIVGDGSSAVGAAFAGDPTPLRVEVQVLHVGGAWRWLRCSIAPLETDDGTGAVMVARDVTAEREIQEMKADFVATVSHELRTPLTPIRGGFELLRARGDAMTPAQTAQIHGSIARQLDRLGTLVADLLVVADLDRGGETLRAVALDVTSVVQAAVAHEAVDGRPVTVDAPGPVGARGDAAAVERILRALVDNGLKHTDGAVAVEVRSAGGSTFVDVVDDGPGIPVADRERIFERFARLGDHLHRAQGPGLGLSIARALARKLGGDVTVADDAGGGAVFRLELPSAVLAERSEDATARPRVSSVA
ncbi:MAG: PAS domain-containing protein [Actinobacteria bacterium]|nr:PAS domain-containing protein [Actinomycetota bacterium]